MSASTQIAIRAVGHAYVPHCIDPALVEASRLQAVAWGMFPPRGSPIRRYEETTPAGNKVPARIEGIADTQGPLGALVRAAQQHAEFACGRPLALFKDKVNFKHPGGGHFVAHQDSPAYYPHGSWHISVLVPLVPFTEANGALEVADRVPLQEMSALQGLKYSLKPVYPGDCLIFDGLTPHRSGPNTTGSPRIGLYVTFVDAADTSARRTYHEAKLRGTNGLSLGQVDFTGDLVASNLLASTASVPRPA